MLRIVLAGLALLLAPMLASMLAMPALAQEGELAPMPVWPAGVPAIKDWPGLAKVPVREELRENGEQAWNVTVPTLQPFLPDPAKATGMAVVIAPGGGFRLLAIHHEGTRVARWLAAHGIAAFVLKYRLIQSPPGETNEAMRQRVLATLAPGVGGIPGVEDGMEALRIVRANAAKWKIDPHRVGVMGFSAGGHVAGMTMLAPNPAERPDFAALIYGMPFGPTPPIPPANLPSAHGTSKEPWLLPPPTPAPGRLPPMFMVMAQDDMAVDQGFRAFYDRVFAAGYRPELHLYQRGGHGFGMATRGTTADHWIEQFGYWLDAEMVRK
jgi:acetyl esterase/lipase